jgi:hypothetical protein
MKKWKFWGICNIWVLRKKSLKINIWISMSHSNKQFKFKELKSNQFWDLKPCCIRDLMTKLLCYCWHCVCASTTKRNLHLSIGLDFLTKKLTHQMGINVIKHLSNEKWIAWTFYDSTLTYWIPPCSCEELNF